MLPTNVFSKSYFWIICITEKLGRIWKTICTKDRGVASDPNVNSCIFDIDHRLFWPIRVFLAAWKPEVEIPILLSPNQK